MTRQRIALIALAAALALAAAAEPAQAQSLARRIGVGYSAGYNAPCQCNQAGAMCSDGAYRGALGFGCCQVPAHWRVHVWDDYPNEPLAQRWAGGWFHPAAPVAPPMKTIYQRNSGDAGYGGYGAGCPNCLPGGETMPSGTSAVVPNDKLVPTQIEEALPTSARRVRRDRST